MLYVWAMSEIAGWDIVIRKIPQILIGKLGIATGMFLARFSYSNLIGLTFSCIGKSADKGGLSKEIIIKF